MIWPEVLYHCQVLVLPLNYWVVATHIWFFENFHPGKLGKWIFILTFLTHIFQRGWNHQLDYFAMVIFLSIQIWNHKPTHTHTHTHACIDTVDGSEIRRSPVEGMVLYPSVYEGFGIHPNGGWPWDFFPSTVSVTPWKTQSHGGLESMIFQKMGWF